MGGLFYCFAFSIALIIFLKIKIISEIGTNIIKKTITTETNKIAPLAIFSEIPTYIVRIANAAAGINANQYGLDRKSVV